jgi:integrase
MQNVRRHKSGNFEARIQINKVPYSAYGDTEEEAAKNLEEKILRSQNLRESYTFEQWMVERYLPSIQTTSKKHQEKAAWAIKHLEHLANRPISQIDRANLQAAFVKKSKTLKPETLKTLKSVWAAALNLAEADDIIIKNPMRFVKLPRSMPEPKAVLGREQLLKLIDHSRGYAAHPIVVLGSLMGLRIGEICRLYPTLTQPVIVYQKKKKPPRREA